MPPFRSAMHLLALTLLSALLATSPLTQAAEQQAWVTSWSMSPSSLPPRAEAADAFSNQTLRQIVHTSAGGDRLRIRLSNTHGDQPLEVGGVTVARQEQGSRFVPDTLRTLTFSQREAFTIPRGGVVFSDPIDFDVPASGTLGISLYLPDASGPATEHRAAMQTTYIAGPGDFTAATDMPDAADIAIWYYLTAVDVQGGEQGTERPGSTIVAVGDSITDGVGSTVDSNNRWPAVLARRLLANPDTAHFAVANAGLSGNRVLHENSPRFGENLQARFQRDVLALANVSHIILLQGINDIGMSTMYPGEEVSADDIIAGYRQIIARSRDRDITVIGATLTPFRGAGYFTEEGELKRQQVNAWIRDSGAFDAVIDFEAVVMDPDAPQRLRADFTADNLHPNDAGYRAMGESIDLELFMD